MKKQLQKKKTSRFVIFIMIASFLLSPIAPVLAEESVANVSTEENPAVGMVEEKREIMLTTEIDLTKTGLVGIDPEKSEKIVEKENKNEEAKVGIKKEDDATIEKEDDTSDESSNEKKDDLDGMGKTDERDFSNIIKQTTEYTCGPAALATLINLMGGKAEEMEMAKLSGTTEEKGTTMLGLKKAAKSLGYEINLKNVGWNSLKKQVLPILAHENNKEYGSHYIVIKEIGDDMVKIADPSAGNIDIGKDEFKNSFDGKILSISLPKEIKTGQSADVALQILENKGIEEININGKMVDIDDLQEDLSDATADGVNGKFAQLLIIPVADIGYMR